MIKKAAAPPQFKSSTIRAGTTPATNSLNHGLSFMIIMITKMFRLITSPPCVLLNLRPPLLYTNPRLSGTKPL